MFARFSATVRGADARHRRQCRRFGGRTRIGSWKPGLLCPVATIGRVIWPCWRTRLDAREQPVCDADRTGLPQPVRILTCNRGSGPDHVAIRLLQARVSAARVTPSLASKGGRRAGPLPKAGLTLSPVPGGAGHSQSIPSAVSSGRAGGRGSTPGNSRSATQTGPGPPQAVRTLTRGRGTGPDRVAIRLLQARVSAAWVTPSLESRGVRRAGSLSKAGLTFSPVPGEAGLPRSGRNGHQMNSGSGQSRLRQRHRMRSCRGMASMDAGVASRARVGCADTGVMAAPRLRAGARFRGSEAAPRSAALASARSLRGTRMHDGCAIVENRDRMSWPSRVPSGSGRFNRSRLR